MKLLEPRFNHPRIGSHKKIASDFGRHLRRTHHAPFVELGVGLTCPHARAHQLGVHYQLAEPLLGMRQAGIAERLRHQKRDAEDQFTLGKILGCALMGRMPRRVGFKSGAVDEVHVAQQEHALPRHQHIVEKDHAVHVLEARGERMVEVRMLEVETLAA